MGSEANPGPWRAEQRFVKHHNSPNITMALLRERLGGLTPYTHTDTHTLGCILWREMVERVAQRQRQTQ